MAAITDTDVSIDASGNIRWASNNTTTHTVLEFIQWLQDKQDDGQAAGDDLLDITVDTPFERSTDQILTLNSPFNIDDNFATHLYDGSVSQTDPTDGGETLWSGLAVIGPVESGTEYVILQGGVAIEPFWGTGINPEAAPSLVFSRHLVKSKLAGANLDGQRITVLARELGDQYRRFPVTLGTANSVAAIGNGSDLFNTSTDATLAGYFGTILNTEGFQDIDIEGTGTTYEFFSQWADGGQSTNDVYEYTKWISQRSTITRSGGAAFGTHTGAWIAVDNGTDQGIAQEFTAPSNLELLTAVKVKLRFQGTRTSMTGNVYAELYLSDDAGTAAPTGSVLARSENIPITRIQNNSTGETITFTFNYRNPAANTDQRDTMDMTGSEQYFIAIRHDEGTATEYIEVDGDITSPAGSEFIANYNGASWVGDATQAFDLEVFSAPEIHGWQGDKFEGISVDVGYDADTGTGLDQTLAPSNPYAVWGTKLFYDNLSGGPFFAGEPAQMYTDNGKGTFVTGCTILYDDGTDELIIAQDTLSSVTNDYYIEGLISGANCLVNTGGGATVDNDKSGGTGIVCAIDDNTGSGEAYIQVVSGVNPVDNSVLYDSSAAANSITATAVITSRTLNPEFLGTSTGSNIIGAYGQCFLPSDVGSSDTFFDLGNQQRTPPNNQTFTVSGLVAGEDRVLVGPRSTGTLNKAQLATDVTLSATDETTVQISTALPAGTPASGTMRVELNSGIYKRIRYEAIVGTDYTILNDTDFVSGDVDTTDGASGNSVNIAGHNFVTLDKVQLSSTTTLPGGLSASTDYWIIRLDADNIQFAASVADAVAGTDVDITSGGTGTHTITPWENVDSSTERMSNFSTDGATQPKDAFLTYIDTLARTSSESYTAVYTTPVDLFVRVRDGGATPIKTFEQNTAQFLGTPQTVAAVRTADFSA